MEILSMDAEGVRHFCAFNQKVIRFVHISVEDYSAARCCYLNGLMHQGAIIGEQAVEKILKGLLLYLKPDEKVGARFRNHQLSPLVERIQEIQDMGLTEFLPVAQRLSDLYDHCRYPDSKVKFDRLSMSSEDVHTLDSFYFHLVDVFPLPLEVKYRTGIYAQVGEPNRSIYYHPTAYWIAKDNKAFANRQQEIERNYLRVLNHLYPSAEEKGV